MAFPEPEQPQLRMKRMGFDELPPLAWPDGFTLRHNVPRAEAEAPWLRLIGRAFEEDLPPEAFVKRMLEHDGFQNDRLYFVQAPDGTLCATVAALGVGDEGYVHYVAVDPDYQGRRLGYAVSLLALHRFRDRGLRAATLMTDDFRTPALRTYWRLGFRPWMTDPSHPARWEKVQAELGLA